VAFKDPKAITEAGVETGAKKAKLSRDKALVAGFLAGAYIAFGAMVAISVSSGLDPKTGARCRRSSPARSSPSASSSSWSPAPSC
jgi:formate/nitrite transporter FocA (FNT family)